MLAFVGLLALVSAAASSDEQGWALGIGASMTALAFFLAGLPAATLTLIPLGALLGIGGLIVLAALLPLRAAWRPGVGAPGSTAEARPAA